MKLCPILVAGALATFLYVPSSFAQVAAPPGATPRPRPGGRPDGTRPGPPPMINFDEATARDYLAHIDEQRNATSLQMGLFMGRRADQNLTPDKSIELIKEQIAKETPGSRRWAMLENLIGFGGFRAPGLNGEANAAYQALFSTPAAPEAAPLVESALRAYLFSVGSTGIGRGDSSSTPAVMLAALTGYLALPFDKPTPATQNPAAPAGAPAPQNRMPNAVMANAGLAWGEALRTTGASDLLAKEIEKRLKDPALTGAARFRVLRVGAQVNEEFDAERAVELITEATPLAAQFAPDDINFTDLQVRILAANGKVTEAIAARKASVARSGKGRSSLIPLLARKNDVAGIKAIAEELKQPTLDVDEMQSSVVALQRIKGVEGLDGLQLARTVAENYLNSPRERTPEDERSMKMTLARLLYGTGDKEGAIKLLQSIPAPTDETDFTYRGVANVLKQMQAGTYDANL